TEYDRRAQATPTVATLLLAARIDADPARARERIVQALVLGPRNAWPHYALAHLETRESNWALAQKSLQRALDLDKSHLAARRLEAALLVRNGRVELAARALELWLAAAE